MVLALSAFISFPYVKKSLFCALPGASGLRVLTNLSPDLPLYPLRQACQALHQSTASPTVSHQAQETWHAGVASSLHGPFF